MYMSAKSEKELETLIQTVIINNQNIRMEFGIEKYTMLVIKGRKRYIIEGVEISNPVVISTLGEKKNYKYSGILEVDTLK